MTVFCAEAWANEAIGRQSSDSAPSHMVAASFYENAIQKYRAVPKAYREVHNVDARIAELRTELNKAGEKSLEEMGVISSEPVDISELVQNARRTVRGKPRRSQVPSATLLKGARPGDRFLEHLGVDFQRRSPVQCLARPCIQ